MTYRLHGLATVRYPTLEVTATLVSCECFRANNARAFRIKLFVVVITFARATGLVTFAMM